jgi:hypothetical protein
MVKAPEDRSGHDSTKAGPLASVDWHTHLWELNSMGRNALEILGTPPHHKIRQELVPEELAQGLSASYEVGRHLISVLHGPVPRNIPG